MICGGKEIRANKWLIVKYVFEGDLHRKEGTM